MNPDAPRWPEGNRSCVALAFDLDGPTGDAMLDGSIWNNPSYFTLGSYGPWRALGRCIVTVGALGRKRAWSADPTVWEPG